MPTPVSEISSTASRPTLASETVIVPPSGILDGVFNDIITDLRQFAGIGKHFAFVLNLHDNLLAALLGQRIQAGNRFAHRIGQHHHFPAQAKLVAVDMHQRQQIADDGGQPVDLLVDSTRILMVASGVFNS